MNGIEYLNPSDGEFYLSETGMPCYRNNSTDFGRITVLRMFPFKFSEQYLSVRTENYKRSDKFTEIGIIRYLTDFPDNQSKIIREELEKRYFIPEIISTVKVSEEFGHTLWETVTTAGPREFTVTDMGSNLVKLDDKRIMLIDVYGNRYLINDLKKISDKALKIIEIWL